MRSSSKSKAWLELLRVPNLLTVPGDPIAGYLLSGGAGADGLTRLVPITMSSVCFYCFGLIMNDLADAEVDRVERPGRPIPSGRVSLAAARLAAVFFLVWGLAMAWITSRDAGIVASVLSFAVIGYNMLLKRMPLAGPVSMGACRGLSMMMGAAAGGGVDYRVILGIGGLTLYVAAFSSIARLEMTKSVIGARKWLPAVVLAVLFGVFLGDAGVWAGDQVDAIKAAVPAVLSLGLAVLCGRRLVRACDIPAVIGGFIANIMVVQSALCCMAGTSGFVAGALIASMVPVFLMLSLRFYSS